MLAASLTASAQTTDWKRSGCARMGNPADGTFTYIHPSPTPGDESYVQLKLTACGEMTLTLNGDVGEVSVASTTNTGGETMSHGARLLWHGSQTDGQMTSVFKDLEAYDFVPVKGHPIHHPFTEKEPPQAYYMVIHAWGEKTLEIIPACACLLP